MDYRSYRLPSTPRSARRGYLAAQHDDRPPSGSRSWHGARDYSPFPRRARRPGRSRRPPRNGEWQPWQSQPRGRGRWNSAQKRKDMNSSRLMSGPTLSPFDAEDNWEAPGFSSQPRKIPQMISPNTREQSFTEIMNGAFDLEKSPLSLGKKLANNIKCTPTDWTLQDPFRDESSVRLEDFIATTPTPMRSIKQDPAMLFGQPTRQMTARDNYLKPEAQLPSMNYDKTGDPLPLAGGGDDITVGLALARDMATPQAVNFDRLLQMIQQNTAQSKELYNLLSAYLNKGRSVRHGSSSSTNVSSRGSTKQLSMKDQSDLAPQIATLACGGDSPDPPRDHTDPFRGHMIDRMDDLRSSVDASSDAHSRTQSEAGWGSSTISSLFSEHRNKPVILSSTLSPLSDSQYGAAARQKMLWETIQPPFSQLARDSTSDGSSSLTIPILTDRAPTRPAGRQGRNGFAPSPNSINEQITLNTANLQDILDSSANLGPNDEQAVTDDISLSSPGATLANSLPDISAEAPGSSYEMQEIRH